MNDPGQGRERELGIADLVGPDLRVLFCRIDPGQRSGELGLHFARPGNRFWKLLHAGGFTDHVLVPSEQAVLPALGIGITNLVDRVTVAASELDPRRVTRRRPRVWKRRQGISAPACVAQYLVSVPIARPSAARAAEVGERGERLAASRLWLLPNPSGLPPRYQMPR